MYRNREIDSWVTSFSARRASELENDASADIQIGRWTGYALLSLMCIVFNAGFGRRLRRIDTR
jgi:hypothetical protein